MNRRASLHEPRKPRNMVLTTKNEKVEIRWVRKIKPDWNCTNMAPLDTIESNGLGMSSGTCPMP